MKQRFLESKYRDDIIALAVLLLLSADHALSSGLALFAGAVFAAIPRVVTLLYSEDGRSRAERARAVVLFCLYFLFSIWSLDWGDTFVQPIVQSFFFGAAFYQMMLWLAMSRSFKREQAEVQTVRDLYIGFAVVGGLCTLIFAIRLFQGVSLEDALRSYYMLVIVLIVAVLRRDHLRKLN